MKVLVCVAITSGLSPKYLTAFCYHPDLRVESEYFWAGAVLIGTVTGAKEGSDGLPSLYTIHVDKVFHGAVENSLVLEVPNSTSRLSFDLREGDSYLLFLKAMKKGVYGANSCGHSGPLKLVSDTIKAIELIGVKNTARENGTIRGRVVANGKGVGNIRFYVLSSEGRMEAFTNSDGWFRVSVPEGRYYLVPESPTWLVKQDDLSLEGPFAVTVNYGGGVDVQFEAVEK